MLVPRNPFLPGYSTHLGYRKQEHPHNEKDVRLITRKI